MLQKFISTRFNKIRFIDLIILALVILSVLFFYLLLIKRGEDVVVRFKVSQVYSLYQSQTDAPNNEYSEFFSIGDTQKDELGSITAEILDIHSFRINQNQIETYLDVRVKATLNNRTNKYTLSGKNLIFGETFIFNFSNIHVKLIALETPLSDIKRQEKMSTVEAELLYNQPGFEDVMGVMPHIANAIKAGDKMTSSNGEILAEVLSVNISPAKQVINTNNNSTLVDHPYLKKVTYTLKVKTVVSEQYTHTFDYTSLQIGSSFPLDTKNVIVWPTITKIHNEE
jgi:hypothetical protein